MLVYSNLNVKAHLIMEFPPLHKVQIVFHILLNDLLVCTQRKSKCLLDVRSGDVLDKPTSPWTPIFHLDKK
jgi:hypothetical protein